VESAAAGAGAGAPAPRATGRAQRLEPAAQRLSGGGLSAGAHRSGQARRWPGGWGSRLIESRRARSEPSPRPTSRRRPPGHWAGATVAAPSHRRRAGRANTDDMKLRMGGGAPGATRSIDDPRDGGARGWPGDGSEVRKAFACRDAFLPHDGGRGDRHVRWVRCAGREDRRLAKAQVLRCGRVSGRLARCADGDAVGPATDGGPLRPARAGQAGQQEQPKQAPGTHWAKGGGEDRAVQGLRRLSRPPPALPGAGRDPRSAA
jgi:hypothetical protein